MGQAAPEQAGAAEAPRGGLPGDSALSRRALAGVAVFAAAAVALGFLLLPIVAIFARVTPGRLVAQLSRPVVTDALLVSLKTSAIAQGLVLVFGTPAAYLLATRRFRGRSLAVVLVELPLVLPPAVAGIGLIAAFGRFGLLGGTLDALGVRLGLTQAAVVIAVAFVASPLYVRQAIATFEAVDPDLVAAARTLGAGPVRTFFRVVLPLARRGLAAGGALAFARGLGEFGATIMFAGNLRGVTQTLPLAIYQQFDIQPDGFTTALAMSALLVVVSGALLVSLRLALQWQPSKPISRFLFAPSP
jgi:molybdate transport system permease protein